MSHSIEIAVAKLAKAHDFQLPDADLISFGVVVWNAAVLAERLKAQSLNCKGEE